MESKFFLGCDLSQDTFTFCLRDRSGILLEGRVENSSKAIRKWIGELRKIKQIDICQTAFCMEHTGVYGSLLLRALAENSLLVFLENAVNIKLSLGLQRGKNDKIDAQRIAEYAMRNADRLRIWKPKRRVLEDLQLLIKLRERLVKSRKEISRYNQDAKRFMEKSQYKLLMEGSEASLLALKKDIDNAELAIAELIKSDDNLNRLSKLICSVDGVGIVTCCTLLVKTNEFLDITEAKKFACTAGVAPFEHSSGKSVRGRARVSHCAHKDAKSLLHMCAISVISRKGVLQDYYLRKVSEGKNKMSVINAVRNKIVHRIFAVVRDNTMYQKNYHYELSMS